jgi:uncharacterized membrane protein
MEVKVKRSTGIMGGTSKIVLIVNEKDEAKLKTNEEYVVSTEISSVKLKARQWFFGSNDLEVKDNSAVEIKTNPTCIVLLFVSLILVIISGATEVSALKMLFSVVGVLGLLATVFYSIKSWFKLEVED